MAAAGRVAASNRSLGSFREHAKLILEFSRHIYLLGSVSARGFAVEDASWASDCVGGCLGLIARLHLVQFDRLPGVLGGLGDRVAVCHARAVAADTASLVTV